MAGTNQTPPPDVDLVGGLANLASSRDCRAEGTSVLGAVRRYIRVSFPYQHCLSTFSFFFLPEDSICMYST